MQKKFFHIHLMKYSVPLALILFFSSCGSRLAEPSLEPSTPISETISTTLSSEQADYKSNQTSSDEIPVTPNGPTCATDFLSQMTVGWNLGNSFDSCVSLDFRNTHGTIYPSYYETAWGNPIVSEELIESVSDAGFNTIRIPVTWFYNTYYDDGNLRVQEMWLERIQEVVDICLEHNLFVILDSHHDGEFIYADSKDYKTVASNAKALWSSIAAYFSDYDNRLIFEGYNEMNDSSNSWKPSKEKVKINNKLNQVFVDTVRNCGGYNPNRILIVGSYLNLYDDIEVNNFKLPKDTVDDHILIDVHCYSTSFNQELEADLDAIQAFSDSASAPIIIGEFGTTGSYEPADYREIHVSNYLARAEAHGIKCIWWDNGNPEEYGIFDRTTAEPLDSAFINAFSNPKAFETDYLTEQTIQDSSLFVYKTLDPDYGDLIDSEKGTITYIGEDHGMKINPGTTCKITLNIQGSGDGMRISQVVFFDENDNYLETFWQDSSLECSIIVPDNATYMKFVLYNPWGVRSWRQYESMFKKKDLTISIKQFS